MDHCCVVGFPWKCGGQSQEMRSLMAFLWAPKMCENQQGGLLEWEAQSTRQNTPSLSIYTNRISVEDPNSLDKSQ